MYMLTMNGQLVAGSSETEREFSAGELSGGGVQIVSVSGEPRPESLSLVTKITVNELGGPSSPSMECTSGPEMNNIEHYG